MLIEPYAEKYQQDIIGLVSNFYDESLKEYDTKLELEALKVSIEKYKETSFLLIIEGKCQGVIAGTTVTTPLNNEKVYQEIIWYVNKPYRRYGVMFLNNTEAELKKLGYKTIIMACLHNSQTDKLFRLYERLNFKPFETHFLKRL